MTKLRSALVVLAAVVAAALMLGAPASQAAIVQAADHPTVAANLALTGPGTDAKKAEFSLAANPPPLVITAFAWTDSGGHGYRTSLAPGSIYDCDDSGYVFTFPALSRTRQTSSFTRGLYAPRCNTVGMTATYGGTAVKCIPLGYVGAAFNDVIAKVRIYHTAGCG